MRGESASAWGEVRSLVHARTLTTSARADMLDGVVRGWGSEDEAELRSYILDHLPSWEPTSPDLPYELVRTWMRGGQTDLLGVLCSDRRVVNLLRDRAKGWHQSYLEFVDSYFSKSYSAWSYGSLPLSAWERVYEDVSKKGARSRFCLWDANQLARPVARERGESIAEGVLREGAYPGFEAMSVVFSDVEGLFEDGWVVDVELSVSPDAFEFSYIPYREHARPEPVALFRYFASLPLKDTLLHETEFEEPCAKERRGVRALESLWRVYIQLCGGGFKHIDLS